MTSGAADEADTWHECEEASWEAGFEWAGMDDEGPGDEPTCICCGEELSRCKNAQQRPSNLRPVATPMGRARVLDTRDPEKALGSRLSQEWEASPVALSPDPKLFEILKPSSTSPALDLAKRWGAKVEVTPPTFAAPVGHLVDSGRWQRRYKRKSPPDGLDWIKAEAERAEAEGHSLLFFVFARRCL